MLVLSRKKNESIVINNDITIVVVEIRGDKVRLGVEAPKEVPVHRREVYDAIRRNERADRRRCRSSTRPIGRQRHGRRSLIVLLHAAVRSHLPRSRLAPALSDRLDSMLCRSPRRFDSAAASSRGRATST